WTLAVLTIWPPACASQPNEGEILMSRARSVLGIAVLFALALSAFAASGASAKGTTAYTCVTGAGTFLGDHCLTAGQGGSGGESKHVAIEPNTTTTGTATNANTTSNTTAHRVSILKGVISGLASEIECTEVHGEGTFENRTEGETMYAHAEGKLHYTGCKVLAPAGKGCVVANEGTITTEQLTGRTEAEGHLIKITPKEGAKFATITLEKCTPASLNQAYPVEGSLKVVATGATLSSTHAEITTQGTLKFGGQKAGLEGALTLKAHSKAGEETNPLTVTTS
ncbi:MAG TPA: hypothetical protein VFJ57_11230, partial [Solirubrobacterales bacterium]|nr:hypothetical protein [Solirubrobacterales bacterium]